MQNRPFVFHTSLDLVTVTEYSAKNVSELLSGLRGVDASSIFHHTHNFFRDCGLVQDAYYSDFSRWVWDSLREPDLANALAGIDLRSFSDAESLRAELIRCVEETPSSDRNVPKGVEFYFCKPLTLVMPTGRSAKDLGEFAAALRESGANSFFHHMFESRMKRGRKRDDYSEWIGSVLGDAALAEKIAAVNVYSLCPAESRQKIIKTVEEHAAGKT